jgi:hypothetical protein
LVTRRRRVTRPVESTSNIAAIFPEIRSDHC